jgi:hypothetical protein
MNYRTMMGNFGNILRSMRKKFAKEIKKDLWWENLYCLGRGEHSIIHTAENEWLFPGKEGMTMAQIENRMRKIISQKMAYYGKKHGKRYAVRKIKGTMPGEIKVWRME